MSIIPLERPVSVHPDYTAEMPVASVIPFNEMATPTAEDAMCAYRAVQLSRLFRSVNAPEDVFESTEHKLRERLDAAVVRSLQPSAEQAIGMPGEPVIPTLAVVAGEQAVEIAVDFEEVAAMMPDAETVAGRTGVHLNMWMDDEAPDLASTVRTLPPAIYARLKQSLLARAIVEWQQATEQAKHDLEEGIGHAQTVPVLAVDELACLEQALRAMALTSPERWQRTQARTVLIEYGMEQPTIPVRAVHHLTRYLGIRATRREFMLVS